MLKIAVLVSGSGTNLQSLIDGRKEINYKIEMVISDRDCYGLVRAKNNGIETMNLDRKIYRNELSDKIDKVLSGRVDLIVLAGFLSILGEDFTDRWKGKVINIHPSLLPKFGGAGMYGMNIHRAVIEAGERESGATVHFVDGGVDTGDIIIQKRVEVIDTDSPDELQRRVLALEHKLLPEAVRKIAVMKH